MQYISEMQTLLSCFVIISEATSQSIHHKNLLPEEFSVTCTCATWYLAYWPWWWIISCS